MSNPHAYSDRDRELIKKLVHGIAEGKLQPSDLVKLEPGQIADGWRKSVALIGAAKVDERVILTLNVLHAADPSFPSANFVLGLAYEQFGDLLTARKHFQAQLSRGEAPHHKECKILLEEIAAHERTS